jgi:hypothetical protein
MKIHRVVHETLHVDGQADVANLIGEFLQRVKNWCKEERAKKNYKVSGSL